MCPLMMTSMPGTAFASSSSSDFSASDHSPEWERQTTSSAPSRSSCATISFAVSIALRNVTGEAKGATSAASSPITANRPTFSPPASITAERFTRPRSNAGLQRVVVGIFRVEDRAREQHERQAAPVVRGREDPREAVGLQVELVVAEAHGVVPDRLHQAQLHGLLAAHHVEQAAHQEVARVDREHGVGPLGAHPPDERGDARDASDRRVVAGDERRGSRPRARSPGGGSAGRSCGRSSAAAARRPPSPRRAPRRGDRREQRAPQESWSCDHLRAARDQRTASAMAAIASRIRSSSSYPYEIRSCRRPCATSSPRGCTQCSPGM